MIFRMNKAQRVAAASAAQRPSLGGKTAQNDDGKRFSTVSAIREHVATLQRSSDPSVGEQRFNLAMVIIIVINIALIAVDIDWGPSWNASAKGRTAWIIIDSIFIVIFIAEVCVRIGLERHLWAKSYWNWFDVVIIIPAMVDIWVLSFLSGKEGLHMLVILRIVRLMRLIRMVKFVWALQGLYVTVMAFGAAMRSMSFVCSMMVFGLLLSSIFSVTVIGRNSAFDGVLIYEDTVYDRFGTVDRSMYSLFELMTLEGWDCVARPLVERQPWIFAFLFLFTMVFTYGLLNMVVASVAEKTLEQTKQMREFSKRQKMVAIAEELFHIESVFREAVADSSATLTAEELERVIATSPKTLEALGLPVIDVQELFTVLDRNNTGSITEKEFMNGITKLQSSGQPSTRDAMVTTARVRKLNHDMSVLEQHLEQMDRILEDRDQLLQEGLSIAQDLQEASNS